MNTLKNKSRKFSISRVTPVRPAVMRKLGHKPEQMRRARKGGLEMRINITVDESTYKKIVKISKYLGLSVSGMVNVIVKLALNNGRIKELLEDLEREMKEEG